MQKVLDVTWDYLLPALHATPSGTADAASQNALKSKLAGLKMRAIDGSDSSPIALSVSGKKFKFADNSEHLGSLSVAPGKDSTALRIEIGGKQFQMDCASGKWSETRFTWPEISPLESSHDEPAAVSGAWNGNTLTAKIAFTETPYVLTLKCDFSKEQVAVDPEFNVAFGPTKKPQMIGRPE
jgi:hypothetical protein